MIEAQLEYTNCRHRNGKIDQQPPA